MSRTTVYEQKSDEIVLSVKIDNVAENVPDYFFDATEGFDFNGVNNIMPGTFVPVDFTINAGGDEGPYNYNHVLVVDIFTNDGYRDTMRITPPAYGETMKLMIGKFTLVKQQLRFGLRWM